MQKADVVVIGGGLIGTSATYYLTKMGKDVILLEREDLALGASGACTAAIALQSKRLKLLEISLESSKLYDQLAEELDCNIELRKSGMMIIIENDERMETYSKFVKEQRMLGLDVEMLSMEESRRYEPSLSKNIAGSTFSPLDKYVNPMYVVFGLAEASKKQGAKIYTSTEVQGIRTKDAKVSSVVTNRGEIKTDTVINAAGPYASEIGRMVNLDIPVKPVKGQEVVTEPVSPFIRHGFLSAGYMELKHKYAHQRFSAGFVLEQTQRGNILVGTTRELAGYDRSTTIRGIKAILQNAVNFVPALKHMHIIRTFAGIRPDTPDGLPTLGGVEGLEGFIIATGHGGDGVALAPATGKLIAELIVDGRPSISLKAFSYSRFKNNS